MSRLCPEQDLACLLGPGRGHAGFVALNLGSWGLDVLICRVGSVALLCTVVFMTRRHSSLRIFIFSDHLGVKVRVTRAPTPAPSPEPLQSWSPGHYLLQTAFWAALKAGLPPSWKNTADPLPVSTKSAPSVATGSTPSSPQGRSGALGLDAADGGTAGDTPNGFSVVVTPHLKIFSH